MKSMISPSELENFVKNYKKFQESYQIINTVINFIYSFFIFFIVLVFIGLSKIFQDHEVILSIFFILSIIFSYKKVKFIIDQFIRFNFIRFGDEKYREFKIFKNYNRAYLKALKEVLIEGSTDIRRDIIKKLV